MTSEDTSRPRLNPLEVLELRLAKIDLDRDQAISTHPDPAFLDRTASVSALSVLKAHLNSCGIESSAIDRLLVQLATLHEGGKPPPMLAPAVVPHRPADNTGVQMLKGSLAAIMQLKMDEEDVGRQRAAQWVVDHTSIDILKRASAKHASVTWRTIAEWRDKYNTAPRGTPLRAGQRQSPGRANYELILKRGRQARKNGRANPALSLLDIIEQNFIERLPVLE
jgi:hypothetical protein